jgi:hypothetical protein
MEKLQFSVDEFCEAHGVPRSTFYELLQRGEGPRLAKIGRRTYVTAEAAADWRRELEERSAQALTDQPLSFPFVPSAPLRT